MKLQHALLASVATFAVFNSPVCAEDDYDATALTASGSDNAEFDFGSGSADPWGSQGEDYGDDSSLFDTFEGWSGAESDESDYPADGGVDSGNADTTRRLRVMANATTTNSTKPTATPVKKSAADGPVSVAGGVVIASAALTTLLAL